MLIKYTKVYEIKLIKYTKVCEIKLIKNTKVCEIKLIKYTIALETKPELHFGDLVGELVGALSFPYEGVTGLQVSASPWST